MPPPETLTSSTPGSSSTGSPTGNGFSPAGSPPIIVAFLSVGLFVAGMLSIRFWRLRLGGIVNRQHRDFIPIGGDIGKKPELWDLYADEAKNAAVGWKDIMPLSVTTVKDTSEDREQCRPIALRSYYDDLRTRFHITEKQMNLVAKPQTRIQVAVPIALPSPRRRAISANEKGALSSDCGVEYSIGVVEVLGQVPVEL